MPALNFKTRFADLVASGRKPHTIREQRKRPIKVGDTLHLYTGMRQKGCRRLRPPTVCTAVTDIRIFPASGLVFLERGSLRYPGEDFTVAKPLDAETCEMLARADGFPNAKDFFAWFEKTHGQEFRGQLIEWET